MNSILAWLLARAAEPSTRAGAAAGLGVVATALGQVGASHEAIGAVGIASLLAAVSAMAKADQKVATIVQQVETVETTLAPVAEVLMPKVATEIASVDAIVKKAGTLSNGGTIATLLGVALLGLAGCTAAQVQTAMVDAETAAATGQVICQSGPTFLALVDPSGAALIAKGASAAYVAQACALVGAVAAALPAGQTATPAVVAPAA